MAVKTVAHLNFRGEARAALSFYQSVFGGELAAVTHAQVYGTKDPVEADLVSWGQVVSPEGFAMPTMKRNSRAIGRGWRKGQPSFSRWRVRPGPSSMAC
jgi:PhnB protein